MNRNTIYFLQRVLSAATTALVYALADRLNERNRPAYRKPEWKGNSPSAYRQTTVRRKTTEEPRSMRDQYLHHE